MSDGPEYKTEYRVKIKANHLLFDWNSSPFGYYYIINMLHIQALQNHFIRLEVADRSSRTGIWTDGQGQTMFHRQGTNGQW